MKILCDFYHFQWINPCSCLPLASFFMDIKRYHEKNGCSSAWISL